MDLDLVFKAYDIRGRSDTGALDAELYRAVGVAFAGLLGGTEVAVGRDARPTSPEFARALIDGLASGGSEVVDLGEVPTDLVYFYSGSHEVAGAMVTASHNPSEYNGLKLCRSGAVPVGQTSGLDEIKEMVGSGTTAAETSKGHVTVVDARTAYVDHLFGIVPAGSIGPLKVAVDGGNGMAGSVIGEVFDRLQAELSGLYLEPDGTFPNHPADPLASENLEDLIALVKDGDYDLGVAFDGDADRAFFVDETGAPLSGSTVTSLIARLLLAESPGKPVVHNLITSRAVPEVVTESGGVPIRTRVGHSFIKAVMAESGAIFGGEHSGHYYFAANYRADSGMLAMLTLLRALTDSGLPLSEMRAEVERYASSGEINFAVKDPSEAMRVVRRAFPEAEHDELDGLTISVDDGWLNLRPSNTEPLLRLNVEANDDEGVKRMVERVTQVLEVSL